MEKRAHPRIKPAGLNAQMVIMSPKSDIPFQITGKVMDISYSGIRIKLNRAFESTFEHCSITISLTLPLSGIPIKISGMIRHFNQNNECGLKFTGPKANQLIDPLIFECIKRSD